MLSWSATTVTGFDIGVYPIRAARTVWGPGGTLAMRYVPSSADLALNPVPSTVTVATAIPCLLTESVTRPTTRPTCSSPSAPRLTKAARPLEVSRMSTPASYSTALNTAPTVRCDALNVTGAWSGTTAAL